MENQNTETLQQVFEAIANEYGPSTVFAAQLASQLREYINFASTAAVAEHRKGVRDNGVAILQSAINSMSSLGMIKVGSQDEFLALADRIYHAVSREVDAIDRQCSAGAFGQSSD